MSNDSSNYHPDPTNPDGEFGLSVDPEIFTTPGAGDLTAEAVESKPTEANMFYTQGGTPC